MEAASAAADVASGTSTAVEALAVSTALRAVGCLTAGTSAASLLGLASLSSASCAGTTAFAMYCEMMSTAALTPSSFPSLSWVAEEENTYMLEPANKSDCMCHLVAMTMSTP